MFMKDKFFPLKGNFKITVNNVKTGLSYVHFEDSNTIVYIAKRNVVRMFGNDSLPLRYIQKMKFGDDGYDYVNNVIYPTNETSTFGTAVFTNSALVATFTDDYVATNTSRVTFEAAIEPSEGNGSGVQNYSQAGLFTVDETLQDPPLSGFYTSGLFAIKDFAPVIKTSDIRLVFDWGIII